MFLVRAQIFTSCFSFDDSNILSSGKNGCKCQVDKVSGACHKHFKTKGQADAFIEDWKESVARIYYQAIKKALDDGKRPCDMNFDISGLLPVQAVRVEDTDDGGSLLEDLKLG